MFTGLVEDVGTLRAVTRRGQGWELQIGTALPMDEVALGDSIAVDGVCLTVESKGADSFVAVAGRETLQLTTLRAARAGRTVHLERALRLGDHLGGHLVQGHVDGVGRILRVEPARESLILWLQVPPELSRYAAVKGSICIDGVSLTINEVRDGADGAQVRVNIVPHTAQVTRLGSLGPADSVNLEMDVLAKYVERLLGERVASSGLTLQTLARYGFDSPGGLK